MSSLARGQATATEVETAKRIRALAKNGGVVGVSFGSSLLNQKDAEELKQHIAQRMAAEPDLTGSQLDRYAAQDHADSGETHPKTGAATLDDAADCIDHIVKVAGIDHVGIGSDFDGVPSVPLGLEDVSKMPALTVAWPRLHGRRDSEDNGRKRFAGDSGSGGQLDFKQDRSGDGARAA